MDKHYVVLMVMPLKRHWRLASSSDYSRQEGHEEIVHSACDYQN